MKPRAAILLMCILSIGCGSRETAPPVTINPISRHFRADFRRTWQAVLYVLAQNRFQVASSNPRSGLISTQGKDVGYSEPRGLFRRTYPLRSRLTIWIKPRGTETYVTVTNEEVIILSETESERYPTTTELEHEILDQTGHALGLQ